MPTVKYILKKLYPGSPPIGTTYGDFEHSTTFWESYKEFFTTVPDKKPIKRKLYMRIVLYCHELVDLHREIELFENSLKDLDYTISIDALNRKTFKVNRDSDTYSEHIFDKL